MTEQRPSKKKLTAMPNESQERADRLDANISLFALDKYASDARPADIEFREVHELCKEIERLQRRVEESERCLNHYQARFSLITNAWRSGDNSAVLEAVRKHITAKDCEDADRLLRAADEPATVRPEDLAAALAHRACCGVEHDPAQGKLHGYCVVCGVPWPCDTAKHFLARTAVSGGRQSDAPKFDLDYGAFGGEPDEYSLGGKQS